MLPEQADHVRVILGLGNKRIGTHYTNRGVGVTVAHDDRQKVASVMFEQVQRFEPLRLRYRNLGPQSRVEH